MIFRLRTSKKTMDIFNDLQNKTNLKPFALAKLAIALSLKKDYESLRFNTDTIGLELNKQTITGKFDAIYRCLIEQHCGKHLKEDDYFPKHMKAHIDRGAILLAEEHKYAKDFLSHLANLEEASMIYLDNSATTPIDPEVKEAMLPYLSEEYGNPSSKYYTLAVNAKKAVEESRAKLAELINAEPEEIIFTSCASESNNFIIKGVADYKKYIEGKGNHIITSLVEHKSVLQTCKFLSGDVNAIMNKEKNRFKPGGNEEKKVERGFEVSFLLVNEYGQVERDILGNAIKDNTILVSIIWGNNEIGTLNHIGELAELSNGKNVLFHSDSTQVLGKVKIDVKEIPVDFLSFSAHKIYGPKGIGACFIRKGKYTMPHITALIHGGEQEEGYRAGTLAVHNIVGFGKAAEIAKRDMDKYIQQILENERLIKELLLKEVPNIQFNGHPFEKIPGVLNITIPGINNELLIKKLQNDIALSTGTACSVDEPSYVLQAIGKDNVTKNTLRVTISRFINKDLIIDAIKILSKVF